MSDDTEEEVQPPERPEDEPPWYQRKLVIVLSLLAVGPLALPLVWIHPRLKWILKLYISFAVIGLTWACWELSKIMFEYLLERLKELEELTS